MTVNRLTSDESNITWSKDYKCKYIGCLMLMSIELSLPVCYDITTNDPRDLAVGWRECRIARTSSLFCRLTVCLNLQKLLFFSPLIFNYMGFSCGETLTTITVCTCTAQVGVTVFLIRQLKQLILHSGRQ